MTTRWRMPPENSCGNAAPEPRASGIPTRSSSSTARFRARPVQVLVDLQRLGELVADGEDRGQRRHRVLEDHAELAAADLRQLPVVEPDQLAPVQGDRAGHRGVSGSRPMTASEVADLPEPDSPTMPSVRPGSRSKSTPRTASHPAGLGREGDAQVADRKHREAHARPAEREAGSRASRNPSPISAMDTVSRVTRAAGTKNSHGELDTVLAPSLSIVPSETSGG